MEAAEETINAIEEDEEEVEEEVEVEIEEEVEEEEVEGVEGDGSPDNVDSSGKEMKHADPESITESSSSGKIFVGGVSRDSTEDTFAKHFKKYGEITDSVIMKDKQTQMPRGFGFVTFTDPSVIDKVLADEHVIDGRTVEVKRTVPRENMASKGSVKTKKIFVGGIPSSLTEDELKEHFASYGEVVEHHIMLDHSTGRPRGFGFVTFEDENTVEKIISKGKMHDLGGKQVEVKKAEPKKAGGDPGFSGRAAYGASSVNARGMVGGGAYGYGGAYGSGGVYYGGRGGGFDMGYVYGGVPRYPGFGPNHGGSVYGGGGFGAGNGYGGPGGYGVAYGTGRGFGSRYHPYGR